MKIHKCATCGEEFHSPPYWTEEDARKEAEENGIDLSKTVTVCDDCYNRLMLIEVEH